jgi:putative transposase
MALQNRTIVDQRLAAVRLVKDDDVEITEVARRLGVSRQAIHGWLLRYEAEGAEGLEDRSRRPLQSPNRTAPEIEQRLIAERRRWGFGAKKILRRLQDEDPHTAWPPRSTIDAIFKREGLVVRRQRPKRLFAPVAVMPSYEARLPGEVMTADYKGQFRLGNGRYCYPFTLTDPISRYLLACDAYAGITLEQTWESMMRVFRVHGLPKIMHSDNGVPFGTSGHGRFSTISVRLMKYGVQPAYSRPGHPQDNGRHERMHRTLMECTTMPPEAELEAQQRSFDAFEVMFNHERPHEGLNQDRPARVHRGSGRLFPDIEPVHTYENHFETERVDAHGRIRWAGERIYIAEAFANETIAFEPVTFTTWRVHFASFVIGSFDGANKTFR